ncbi:PIG-L deacetylase family protein [Ilumatobacter sp.]|uniref:PIG-L deacetylase family protein n=1 Tax=Ilumatobacter sp. TaxID=1967498 RepID=UPI003C53844B
MINTRPHSVDEPSPLHTSVNQTRVLGVWAHPDDEAYLSAGLMARTIVGGGQVTVVAITDGEDGFPADDTRPREQRAAQRRRELRAAMEVIGVQDVRFLGVPDGGVANAPREVLVDRIADIIRDVRPDVIVTFGPDGVTGHPDHVANSARATEAWENAGIGDLWYAAKTDEWLDEWRDLHDEFGVWMTEEPTGVRRDEVEEVVDLVGAELDAKRAVLSEHRSQTDGLSRAFGEERYRRWIRQETFRRPNINDRSRDALAGSVAS